MESSIAFVINIVAAAFVLLSLALVLLRFYRSKIQYKLLLAFALLILLMVPVVNILDHFSIFHNVEEFEQIFSVLFLPVLIFSIHESANYLQLKKQLKSEQKFKGIFNQSFSFIGLLNKHGVILEANTTACSFVGYENDEYKGQLFTDTKWWEHSEEEKQKLTDSIEKAKAGETVRIETYHIDKSGMKIYVDFTIKPVIDDLGNVIYLIPEGRDITDIKMARLKLEMHKANLEDIIGAKTLDIKNANEELQVINEELLATNEELNDKNVIINEQYEELKITIQHLKEAQAHLIQSEKMASLGTLTAGVSHEINNPLNYIMGGYTGLQRYFEKNNLLDDQELSIFLEAIQEGTERATRIVKGLNQFSNRTDAFIEDCNINEIIDNCCLILKNKLEDRVILIRKYDLNEVLTIGNNSSLHTLFSNILINSIQAIEGDGEITIDTLVKGNNAIIKIADTGYGITKENLNKVLDPFFTTKDAGKGVGIGLSIAHTIVQEHKGTINIESESGKGTVVTIMLPAF